MVQREGLLKAFMKQWLTSTFGASTFAPLFAVERAHSLPLHRLPSGAPPRFMLMKLLHFRDREAVLRAARERGRVSFNGNGTTIVPDSTVAEGYFPGHRETAEGATTTIWNAVPGTVAAHYQGKAFFFPQILKMRHTGWIPWHLWIEGIRTGDLLHIESNHPILWLSTSCLQPPHLITIRVGKWGTGHPIPYHHPFPM